MKLAIFTSTLLVLMATQHVSAVVHWGNCPGGPQAEPIQDVFWKSDISGNPSGPDYTLKSGQTFSNAGSVCRKGQVLKSDQWIAELKKGLSPAKSISSFKVVQNADDLQNFLTAHKIEVNDPARLKETVAAFLESQPVNFESSSMTPGKASNPVIIVGASSTDVLIALTSSNGDMQSATLMHLKEK